MLDNIAKIGLVGDTHGNSRAAAEAVEYARATDLDLLIQLGDYAFDFTEEFMGVWHAAHCPTMFIRGNHDDPEWIKENAYGELYGSNPIPVAPNVMYLPDGCVFGLTSPAGNTVTFGTLGGAFSIDKERRVAYVSWWPEEVATVQGSNMLIDHGYVDVMLTHDAPFGIEVLEKFLRRFDLPKRLEGRSTTHRRGIMEVVEAVAPSYLYHGHYHFAYEDEYSLIYNGNQGGRKVKVAGLDCDGTPMESFMKVIDLTDPEFLALAYGENFDGR